MESATSERRAASRWGRLGGAGAWLKRRRPVERFVLAGIVAAVAVWVAWASQLWGLPDIGDPFDVAAAGTVNLAAEENAYVDYKAASDLLVRWPASVDLLSKEWERGWSVVDPAVQAVVDQNQEALEVWRQGTTRPGALYHQPKDLRFETVLQVDQDLRLIVRLAGLCGSRLEEKGGMAGAWGWYRAMFRCSRHVEMHGVVVERLIGKALHVDALHRVSHWAADSRTGAGLLRRALAEAIADEAMTPRPSEALKLEYMMLMKELESPHQLSNTFRNSGKTPPWGSAWWWQAVQGTPAQMNAERLMVASQADYERSFRVMRLLFANWLAQCDRPPRLRAGVANLAPLIYEDDPTAPRNARALSPDSLNRWYRSTTLAKALLELGLEHQLRKYLDAVDEERADRAKLIVTLAEQLYLRERGRLPASPQDLVGPYLRELPEGYEPASHKPLATNVGKAR